MDGEEEEEKGLNSQAHDVAKGTWDQKYAISQFNSPVSGRAVGVEDIAGFVLLCKVYILYECILPEYTAGKTLRYNKIPRE